MRGMRYNNPLMPHRTAKIIHREIAKADKILLVVHQEPDGDALGSASALGYFFDEIKKPYHIFCLTEPSAKLHSLPHLKKIITDDGIFNQRHDLFIVLDSGDLNYAGLDGLLPRLEHDYILVNIDHHAGNRHFGQHNLVMEKASSTAEIIYHFFKYNNVKISKNTALSLLTGLITDTDNFTNPGTNPHSLKIASELIGLGANFNQLKQWFIRDKSINSLKLWGTALSRLSRHEDTDIIHTYLTRQDLAAHQAEDSECEGIANFLNYSHEGRAALLLKETANGQVKGNLRTTRDDLDVSAWARQLGGGGHKKAAGFKLSGGIDEALNKVWEVLKNASN